MKRNSEFKFDLIIAFFLFAFLIIVIVIYVSIFFFNNIATQNFQQNIILYSKNLIKDYNKKKNQVLQKTVSISKSPLISSEFNVNENLIFSVFKLILSSEDSIKKISLTKNRRNIYCKKTNNEITCNINTSKLKKIKNILIKEKIEKNSLIFNVFLPIKSNKILHIIYKYPNFFEKYSDMFNILVIDTNGKILYSDFSQAKTIYDIYGYPVVDLIKKDHGFISDDIYVMNINNNYKIVFLQNKKLIKETSNISKKLAIIMIILSVFVAVPLGVFFSKPLYNYYSELDKKINEEVQKVKENEQLLMQQSKLAALGEMLGNIAHQWRHPLTHLSLLIQNLEIAYKKNRIDEKYIENFKHKAMKQIEYMSKTIDDFRNFFKEDKEKTDFIVNESVKEVLFLLDGRLKNYNIDVEIIEEGEKTIYGFKNEFLQVIMNIINNAIDVLNERNIKNKKIWIKIGNVIEIEDNAGGIRKEIIDKIFEPYFTTKFQSQGTGIGLYMSKIIITKHFNGNLYAYNSKNGAVFVIKV
ncbi:sensor histidine kinase [Lebetimonas natsushimae]|uniref:sensor histidine kinase n=1 Tax=Lebetimonas natsushimae TaxID=1936991 RepID=UPI000BB802B3|nr:HAMP domain-containing sensor histidine kinase [Lebetimonas natsushimae]